MGWFTSLLSSFNKLFSAPSYSSQTPFRYGSQVQTQAPTTSSWKRYDVTTLPKLPSSQIPPQQMPARQPKAQPYSRLDAAGRQRAIPLMPYFSYYSNLYRIPWGVLEAMAEKESQMGDPRYMRSGAGAVGLMGLMPPHYNGQYYATWYRSGVPMPKYTTGKISPAYGGTITFNPLDNKDAINHAAWYLREILYKRFRNWEQAIAAYNMGENEMLKLLRWSGYNWKNNLWDEPKDYLAYINQRTGRA